MLASVRRIGSLLVFVALGFALANCQDEYAPGSACDEETSRACGEDGLQFCGPWCVLGTDGLGTVCEDGLKWSRCVEDPVCMPGETIECSDEEKGANWDLLCVLEEKEDGAPVFEDCFH